MELNRKQVCYLRGLAHPKNPLVNMGKAGYGDVFIKEVARGLADHELIKVRMGTDEREDFYTLAEQLADETKATLVQTIGRIVVLYKRRAKDPEIRIPH